MSVGQSPASGRHDPGLPLRRALARPRPVPGRLVALAVGGLGASSVIAQLVLLREMLGTFCGNEMVLGAMLACWLLWTRRAAYFGPRDVAQTSS